MKHCSHSHWLSLSDQSGEPALLESRRLKALVDTLPDPNRQYPSLILLLGYNNSSTAVQKEFGVGRRRRNVGKRRGQIHLHLDSSTAFKEAPILVADGSMSLDFNDHGLRDKKCHETIRRPLCNPNKRTPSGIYSRLLLPFTDQLCIFCDGAEGLSTAVQSLSEWMRDAQSRTPAQIMMPNCLMITESLTETPSDIVKRFKEMLERNLPEESAREVPELEIMSPEPAMSAQAWCRRVKERILKGAHETRKIRKDIQMLFSAPHLAYFFRDTCQQFSESRQGHLDFIEASRAQNPVSPDLCAHVTNLLQQVKTFEQCTSVAIPLLASALFADGYPPNSHLFEPSRLFDRLYKVALEANRTSRMIVFEDSKNYLLWSSFMSRVKQFFIQRAEDYSRGRIATAIESHKSAMTSMQGRLKDLRSSNTCLCCLLRRPQYRLVCGHFVCENCVVVLGDRSPEDPYIYVIHHCFQCGERMPEDVLVRLRPPTAGLGVLCIDGGGTRGIVPLTVMKMIQDRLGAIPLQRCISMTFGVSVGAIIAIDHFILGRPLQDSIKMFTEMTKQVFRRRGSSKIPFISRAVEMVTSYLSDGLYSGRAVDQALQDWVRSKGILDVSHATQTGTKVGLPVATVSSHPTARFFTNYNGVGVRDTEQEIALIKPGDDFGNVPLWEIARAASAAPGFFPPKFIEGVGTLQDVGALENDPIIPALSEAHATSTRHTKTDFVISLGTGEPDQKNYQPSTEDCRGILRNGILQRLMSLGQERLRERQVKRACQTVGWASRMAHKIHRLSVSFDSTEPRLDDTGSIPQLMNQVESDQSLSNNVDELVRYLISSLFYFELDVLPERFNGEYMIRGSVLCSIRCNESFFTVLFERLRLGNVELLVNGWPIRNRLHEGTSFQRDGNFRATVDLTTSDAFEISLRQNKRSYPISGSPFLVPDLISIQGLGSCPRTSDSCKRKRSMLRTTPARKRRVITS